MRGKVERVMKYQYAALTNIGRRDVNEDALNVRTGCYGICAVLADGLGGQGAGDWASGLAVGQAVQALSGVWPVTDKRLEASFQAVNADIRRQQLASNNRMMTTLACLRTNGAGVHFAHVGDTRIYWFRDGRILYQSEDHSMSQCMVASGEITPEQVRGHSSRNLLTRAIGYRDDLQVTTFHGRAQRGDRFLLCTDGFWEWVLEGEMASLGGQQPQIWLDAMEKLLRSRYDQEADNYSAIAVIAE